MSTPRTRRLRMAFRLGNEQRTATLFLRTDSIDAEQWVQKPDGDFSHPQLEAVARRWLLDQLEIRVWTSDLDAGPHLFWLSHPGEDESELVQRAREQTVATTCDRPGRICQQCLEDEAERAPWQSSADAWRGRGGDEQD